MKHIYLVLFILFAGLPTQAQNNTYTARIVDADTGEPLPCVGIFVNRENTTLTNFDGDFRIKAAPTDTLRLTCIGRETLRLCARGLPKVIRMKLLEGQMNELRETDYRVCMLDYIGFSPSDIAFFFNMSESFASKIRKRLHYKIFGDEGKPADFDRKIRSI